MAAKKVRLDDCLVEQGIFPSRDEVLRAVIAHEVRVDDVYVTSAAIKIAPDAEIFIKGKKSYVSRGGYKLQGALDYFDQDVHGLCCIDVGSSTGGFSDCLLQAGAAQVTCVDVNYGQLAWKLRQDTRVTVFERTNIKHADPIKLGAPFDLIVCDLSFIGLAQLADTFAQLGYHSAESSSQLPQSPHRDYRHLASTIFIGLIKPQFESRHEETDHGVVRDQAVRDRVIAEVAQALIQAGFIVDGVVESPIRGPEGNIEYLVRAHLS